MELYKIPAEVAQFVSTTRTICKLHAYPLYVGIKLKHPYTRHILIQRIVKQSYLDVQDWIEFMKEYLPYQITAPSKNKYYVNTNPTSKYYGYIMVSYTNHATLNCVSVTHRNINELLMDLYKWINITADFQPVDFLNTEYAEFDAESAKQELQVSSLTYRDVLQACLRVHPNVYHYAERLVIDGFCYKDFRLKSFMGWFTRL